MLSERIESVHSIALGIWFHQGPVHEIRSECGISHLLEHMVFKGTERRSARDLALEIERIGGALDAYTTHEATAFQARVPAGELRRALDVLADLAFHPTLRERDLEAERNVILEELALLEETPEELVFELHADWLYGEHPYGARIMGSAETVSDLSAERLRRLHSSSYRGSNAVVAAAGHVDHEELVALVREMVPRDDGAAQAQPPHVVQGATGRRRVEREGGHQTHLVAGGVTVAYSDPLRYAVVLVDAALGAGMSSRLFQRIREEIGLAYSVYSFHSFYASGGHGGAYVGTGPETASAALEAMLEELRLLAEQGLADEEVQTMREEIKGRLMLSLEAPVARMNRLAGLALYGEPYRTLDEIAQRIDLVTKQEVSEAAALYHPDRLAIMELAPAQA